MSPMTNWYKTFRYFFLVLQKKFHCKMAKNGLTEWCKIVVSVKGDVKDLFSYFQNTQNCFSLNLEIGLVSQGLSLFYSTNGL